MTVRYSGEDKLFFFDSFDQIDWYRIEKTKHAKPSEKHRWDHIIYSTSNYGLIVHLFKTI